MIAFLLNNNTFDTFLYQCVDREKTGLETNVLLYYIKSRLALTWKINSSVVKRSVGTQSVDRTDKVFNETHFKLTFIRHWT